MSISSLMKRGACRPMLMPSSHCVMSMCRDSDRGVVVGVVVGEGEGDAKGVVERG